MKGHGTQAPSKAKDFNGTLKRLLGYLKPHRGRLIAVIILAILSTGFLIFGPKILGSATEKIFQGVIAKKQGIPGAAVDFNGILKILLFLGVLYLISAIFNFMQQYIMASVAQTTVYDMRKEVFDKINRLPLKYFDSKTHGEILSRVTNDVDTISSTLQQSLTQIITSVVTIIGVVLMMLSISLTMTLITLVTLPLAIFVVAPIIKRSQGFFSNQQKYLGEINGHVEEMYSGHVIVKAFGHEHKSLEEFEKINEELYTAGWKAQFISGIVMPAMNFVNNIGYVAVSVVGGVLVTKGSLTIGNIQAFIQYSRQFTQPISQTANISNILQNTVAAAERVFELLDEDEIIPDAKDNVVLQNPKGEVTFKNVKFGYKEDSLLITDMNLDVKPGQSIAIVGPTGAGKTTLINLLMRFYELNSGEIAIDNVNITKMKRGDLRTTFGMVLQDTWLFNGSIKDNIGYGLKNPSDEEIIEAAKTAQADHFIKLLPQGYDTILNEEASNISQGQKQLLTIARAILTDPTILILDEATSSVDTRTEATIQKAMDNLRHGRTSFVIAHRLSTIKDADIILYMQNGNVLEKGNHEELISKGGLYADLYNSQFAAS
ncbi:MAG: ABC transporter ATP-binding protein [Clostridium sp.]